MGYEFKLKKGKTRMNIKFSYVIGIFLLLLLVLPTFASSNAEAQPMNPSTLLETPNVVEEQTEPEATPEDIPQVSQWRYLNRQILCNTIEVLKTILTTRGQELLVTGAKPPEYVPTDPFDAIIITRNPETGEYTILIVKTDQNLACVIASGTSMKTVDEMQQE